MFLLSSFLSILSVELYLKLYILCAIFVICMWPDAGKFTNLDSEPMCKNWWLSLGITSSLTQHYAQFPGHIEHGIEFTHQFYVKKATLFYTTPQAIACPSWLCSRIDLPRLWFFKVETTQSGATSIVAASGPNNPIVSINASSKATDITSRLWRCIEPVLIELHLLMLQAYISASFFLLETFIATWEGRKGVLGYLLKITNLRR